jgi:hypothetical protein
MPRKLTNSQYDYWSRVETELEFEPDVGLPVLSRGRLLANMTNNWHPDKKRAVKLVTGALI